MTNTAHAELGASNAHRWMACPGSVEAERGLPNPSTEHSEAGTAAHALAKLAYDAGRNPREWVGETVEGVTVDDEMGTAVEFYLQHLAQVEEGADDTGLETRFDLAALKPPVPAFGTTDHYAIAGPVLHISDLKYGKGVRVAAKGNVQGRFYALGVFLKLWTTWRARLNSLKEVKIWIVQPRIEDEEGNPSIDSETLTVAELKMWGRVLLEAMRATQAQMAPRRPGDHCRFCKAKPTCAAFRDQALAVARIEFSDGLVAAPGALPVPRPEDSTPEQIATFLQHREQLRELIDSFEAFAVGELERGRPIPGWALKPKRATRKWNPAIDVAFALAAEFKADREDFFEEPKLKSPAQVEKLVGKGKLPEGLTVAESSGFNLVRDTDPRAVSPAATEFTVADVTQTQE